MDEKNISPTFCVMPWMHLHAWPEGRAMLCCVANGGPNGGEVGDFSKNTFKEIINSDKLKQVRLDLLDGNRIDQCQSCYKQEDSGTGSFRQKLNYEYFNRIDELIKSTSEDGYLNDPKMLYMDFRFSNLCNLGCRTCGQQLSSTIANNMSEEEKNHDIPILKEKNVLSERGTITSFIYARPDFFEIDVLPYIDDCKRFYFAGGEPLMHQEHLDILKYLNDNKLYDKDITYSTNLSILQWKKINFLEIWKNFNMLHFYCSIDGHEEALEYIRDKSNHDIIFSNLDKLIQLKNENLDKSIRVTICYTHSIYNAYYTREFFEYLDESGLLSSTGLSNIVLNLAYGDELSLSILPKFAKEELKEKIKKDLENKTMQKVFTLFPDVKHIWMNLENTINEEPKIPFDVFLNNDKFDLEKAKVAVPWVASVAERYKIV